jgi:hypothetical protein
VNDSKLAAENIRASKLELLVSGRDIQSACPVEIVTESYHQGVRTLILEEPIDLQNPSWEDVLALDTVKHATARGMLIRWTLRGVQSEDEIDTLSHLMPPQMLPQWLDRGKLDHWRRGFYLGKCIWRRGPGFIQIRDRRSGALNKYNLSDEPYLSALPKLAEGDTDVPASVIEDLRNERLLLDFGKYRWLAPYRVIRWPTPTMIV